MVKLISDTILLGLRLDFERILPSNGKSNWLYKPVTRIMEIQQDVPVLLCWDES